MLEVKIPKNTPAQQEIYDNHKRNNLLLLGRRFGKTTFCTRLTCYNPVKTAGYRAAWSAPTWKLMLDAFDTHQQILKPVIERISKEERSIRLINGSIIEYWSSDDPSAGRGRKYHIWTADETQRQKNIKKFIKGSVRPSLSDYRGELWVLGTPDGIGSEFHDFYLECMENPKAWQVVRGSTDMNPHIHPDEIADMRQDLGPELAAQEIDALWVSISGVSPFVRKLVWESLEETKQTPANTRKVLVLDGSVSDDTTALLGVWYDLESDKYFVDYHDIHVFVPDGEIDWLKIESTIINLWNTGRYAQLVYDPYQSVYLAQRLRTKNGIRTFEFTQNSMRTKADSYLYQVFKESRFGHPDHHLLTEHALNASIKLNTDGKQVRIIKQNNKSKIDLLVALSMGIYALKESGQSTHSQYDPHTALKRPDSFPQTILGALNLNSKDYIPW